MKFFLLPSSLRPAFAFLFFFTAFLHAQTPPELAPGLTPPANSRVVVLDREDSTPKLVVLHPTEIKLNTHAAGNFGRSIVYSGPHRSIELPGLTSPVQLLSDHITIFVRLGEPAEIQRSRVTLLRLYRTKTSRVAADFSANIFGGSNKRYMDSVAIEKIDLGDSNWVKLSFPSLQPGEYGIAFPPKEVLQFDDTVYDFTVPGDPSKTGDSKAAGHK